MALGRKLNFKALEESFHNHKLGSSLPYFSRDAFRHCLVYDLVAREKYIDVMNFIWTIRKQKLRLVLQSYLFCLTIITGDLVSGKSNRVPRNIVS